MSSDILKDISDEFLQCQVCFRTYSRPKLLGCLHTFCEACLVDHVPEGTYDITCPVCSQTTPLPQDGVSKLKEDSFISNLVATVGAKKRVLERTGNIPCEGCDDKKNATSRCVVCNDFLCRSCVTAHRKMKVFRGHLVVSFDDMKKGLFDESPELKNGPTCDIHEGEKIRFFCKTCEIPVCHNCTVLDHSLPKHQISRLKATSEELRRDMLHHLNEATRHKSTLDRKSHDIERKKADFLKQNEDTCHRLEKKFEELTHTIDQLKEKALEMTKTKAAIKIQELDTMKEKVDSYRSRLSSGCTYAENILTRGSDAEVAAAFHQMRESLSEGVKCSRRTDQYDPDLTMVWADVYDMELNRLLEEVREVLWRDDALELQPDYVRALLRRAQTYEGLEKLDEALTDYQRVVELDRSCHVARAACMRLPDEIKERNEKMKAEMMDKLKDLGNMVLRPFGLSTANFRVDQNPDSGSYNIQFVQNPNNNDE
ncbi:PREDICTED: E3 ubiquitin-protein ligase TRIM56-like isoform X3 [Branchiostoma belcheri]|uniref:E3 ubiquitin-protein ligase TRIM56-like isoform X3 n=1 Tax=Branchiostoma belcheri TaxID=7741 RepID=A0A6P4Z239_BRABE|nr:PREDICTED: E3 ubiquitin-protein ligase TRIM56-like isoform X3 [Branchiostoma belcheri]